MVQEEHCQEQAQLGMPQIPSPTAVKEEMSMDFLIKQVKKNSTQMFPSSEDQETKWIELLG